MHLIVGLVLAVVLYGLSVAPVLTLVGVLVFLLWQQHKLDQP